MVEVGIGIVIWEVGNGKEVFWSSVVSEVEERNGMEVSGDGMWKLAAGSDDEGTKIFLGIDDD